MFSWTGVFQKIFPTFNEFLIGEKTIRSSWEKFPKSWNHSFCWVLEFFQLIIHLLGHWLWEDWTAFVSLFFFRIMLVLIFFVVLIIYLPISDHFEFKWMINSAGFTRWGVQIKKMGLRVQTNGRCSDLGSQNWSLVSFFAVSNSVTRSPIATWKYMSTH